jgi:hypothetical protein
MSPLSSGPLHRAKWSPFDVMMQWTMLAMLTDQFHEGQSGVLHQVQQHTPRWETKSRFPMSPRGSCHAQALSRRTNLQSLPLPPTLQGFGQKRKSRIRRMRLQPGQKPLMIRAATLLMSKNALGTTSFRER